MTGEIALGAGAEFDVIRRLLERWGPRARNIGDDAAVIALSRGDALIASVDSAFERRHFDARWLTPREIGYRAVTAALSDLAAMAARPVGVLVSIALPDAWRDRIDGLADGIGDAVDAVSTCVVGGNLSDGDELSITTTALGAAFSPLRRTGAKTGDDVYVTGRLGGPAAALRAWERGEPADEWRARFARPVARLPEARWLVDHGASAGIDISDGLASDLAHVAHASSVAIEIDAGAVPRMRGVEIELALRGGEEYELVITSPITLDVAAFESRFGLSLTRIGHVTRGPVGSVVVAGVRDADLRGHDHFAS